MANAVDRVASIGDDAAAALSQKARALARETRNAISTSRTWNFEKLLGNGSYGVTVLLSERDPLRPRRSRKVVLKRPLRGEIGLNDFIREARLLDTLRGHAHIVQLINFAEDVTSFQQGKGKVTRMLKRMLAAFKKPQANLFGDLSQGNGPAILLEYLENGDLLRVVKHIYYRRDQLPNRLLWGWYHCLVRACIAMTYAKEELVPSMELEMLRGDQEHLRLVHDDIAARNVMIGEFDPLVKEHRATPKLTLIDFGLARQLPLGREKEAEDRNLQEVNMLMLDLINPRIRMDGRGIYPHEWNGIRTIAAGLFDERRLCLLDRELRTLLAQSFRITNNGEPFRRPSLAETFERTRRGILKPPESYQSPIRESDDYIRARLQRILLDADNELP
ncbi:hypothetical protein F5Y09DRAFT_112974 [Xylaria sp. FL1042]|nr:hypothetical protein F5Y09DRAFT_112974 [Xylaria sp. FL1042]